MATATLHIPEIKEAIMTLREALAAIIAADHTAQKAHDEIIAKIAALQDSIDNLTGQLANVELSAEQQAAVEGVVASVQALDDIVPDAP